MKSELFKKFNDELNIIIKSKNIEKFNEWKEKVKRNLDGTYKMRLTSIGNLIELENSIYYLEEYYKINEIKLNQIKSILGDMYFKYNSKKRKTKENLEIEKLLKAREINLDFEKELSEMICGDNTKFPYRSSKYLTDFFKKLDFNFTHNGETRRTWIEDRLKELNIIKIYALLSDGNGLFSKKYFEKYINEFNNNPNNSENKLEFEIFYNEAQKEFKSFIKNSIREEDKFNLSSVLDLNINIELLFETQASTEDEKLNFLIEEGKKRFLSNDKQIGLEKLWDAFERLKTYYSPNKKSSAEKVVEKISEDFDKDLINNEFKTLGTIGNSYRIRHHETDKKELTTQHINYFFFRMLSLIDLYLMYYNKID